MQETVFHNYIKACELLSIRKDKDLVPVLAASNMHIYPYQLAAAQFALQKPRHKGVILCDEGSLGKTYEALLIAAQKYYCGFERQLLILPSNLLFQWREILENAIPLPYKLWQNEENLPDQTGLIITTYRHALKHCELLSQKLWDMVIFEEASILSKPKNKLTIALKKAFEGSFKLLLTPTPITISIMDIYGLIHFIDENILPPEKQFYKRYFRKPENYPELSQWVSQFAFRTLKKQVTNYVNFTNRIAFTYCYKLDAAEQAVYDHLKVYLNIRYKQAYPKMDLYDLTLLLYRLLSSSPQALYDTLSKALLRVDNPLEKAHLLTLQKLIRKCTNNSKIKNLCRVLKQQFDKMRQHNYAQKALIFVDNKTTMNLLTQKLIESGYEVIKSSEEGYAQKFRAAKKAILIANGDAARGLNLQFCALVINYDLLYNAIDLEQRISRCHRQGQQRDVVVINFMCKKNIADIRILELINKRLLQFDSIFGRSDTLFGHFVEKIEDIETPLRTASIIKHDFSANLSLNKKTNKEILAVAQEQLFTSFTKKIANNIAITPRYIEEKIQKINILLWQVVKTWFDQNLDYEIDEATQTIRRVNDNSRILFYYNSGTRNVPYRGKICYSIAKDYKPASGRLSLFSPVVKGILANISCASYGEIKVDANILPCEIGLYCVQINYEEIYILVGRDYNGQNLDQTACEKILNLPIHEYRQIGRPKPLFVRNVTICTDEHSLDKLVPLDKIKNKFCSQCDTYQEEIENIRFSYDKQRVNLKREILSLIKKSNEKQSVRNKIMRANLEALRAQKELKQLQEMIKSKEQELHKNLQKIERTEEEEINKLNENTLYTTKLHRHFILSVKGKA